MNLLAHLHLGEHLHLGAAEAAGNLVADFCAHHDDEAYRRGVVFHRNIDAYTDAHPLVAEARNLFSGPFRRFGGVLVDLGFDYCLSHDWPHWEPETRIHDFIADSLKRILSHSGILPGSVVEMIDMIHKQEWLESYGHIDGIGNSIRRIASRRPIANALVGGEYLIEDNYQELNSLFHEFYPQLSDYMAECFASEFHPVPGHKNTV